MLIMPSEFIRGLLLLLAGVLALMSPSTCYEPTPEFDEGENSVESLCMVETEDELPPGRGQVNPADTEIQTAVHVQLDGTASGDPDGDLLQYRWKQIDGPPAVLSSTNSAKPSFKTRLAGVYRFSLVVSDGKTESDPSVVSVKVENQNRRPEAILPAEMKVVAGTPILLNGNLSRDADGNELTYRFRQTAGTPLYLREEDCQSETLAMTFDTPGMYEIQLMVYDGVVWSAPASCLITVLQVNQRPVAQAKAVRQVYLVPSPGKEELPVKGAPVAVVEVTKGPSVIGQRILLDGRGSYSGRKRALRYYWKQRGGPFVGALEQPDGNEAQRVFVPEMTGTYQFQLVVNDGETDSLPQMIEIEVLEGNMPPVAVIQGPEKSRMNEKMVLDGSRSYDPERSAVTYAWRQSGGPRIIHVGANSGSGSEAVFFPPEPGIYQFSLVVSDGQKESLAAEKIVVVERGNAPPTVKAVSSLDVPEGELFLLGARGVDPDGDILQYRWKQVDGETLLEQPALQQQIQLRASRPGAYRFAVTASDGVHESETVFSTVNVRPAKKRSP